MEQLSLVLPHEIPKIVYDCPKSDLVSLYAVALRMQEVCEANNGIGLAAVQVGIPWRFFIVNFLDKFRFFLNSVYVPLSGEKEKSLEGCLSIRHTNGDLRYFEVERYKKIEVSGEELLADTELKVVPFNLQPEGIYRFVYQHEADHHGWPGKEPVLISEIGLEYDIWAVTN